jgi:putative GTP pyrophosphokinase
VAEYSKTQVDRLGDRLRKGAHSEADIRMLDEYRRSFGLAYEEVFKAVRARSTAPTGRVAKSTRSIVEKLLRESLRLSQMQDIAGLRIIVPNLVEQDSLVKLLAKDFLDHAIIDRRIDPSHGYRAVHVIVSSLGKNVEIQIRTTLQHKWAEVSEKAADVLDPAIKYGGGDESWQSFLERASKMVASLEEVEFKLLNNANTLEITLIKGLSDIRSIREHLLKSNSGLAASDPSMAAKVETALHNTEKSLEGVHETFNKIWVAYSHQQAKVVALLNEKLLSLEKERGPNS